MQRSLQLSLRLLCRQRCQRRLLSSQVAAVQHSPHTLHNEPVASGSKTEIDFPDESHTTVTREAEVETSVSNSKKRKAVLEDFSSDRRSRLEQNKVDTYLASLRMGGIEPTLEDLERLRPRKKPSSNSPKYANAYNELVDRLCRTFSKDQLREFGEQLQFDDIWTRHNRRKVEYAETILEKAWGWENLKEIERRKRDMSEILVKSFTVSPSELFLLLGKDGSELLQISVDYNVHISVTANPLSIRIEGLRGSLKNLEKLLVERRKAIIEETTELPIRSPLPQELVQKVSRLANAYIENVGNKGKIRICANDQRHLNGAKRLAVRATMLVNHEAHVPFLVFLPPDPPSISPVIYSHTYSLYPFVPNRSPPWSIVSGNTFRCRRVSDFLGELLGEDVFHPGGLADGKGKFLTETGESVPLRELVRKVFPASDNVRLIASTGHIIFSEKTQKSQPSIIPPFPGNWQFPKFMTWLQEGKALRWFIPSLPAPLHNTSPIQEKILHRLTYRCLQNGAEESQVTSGLPEPTKVLKYEVVLTERTTPTDVKKPEPHEDVVTHTVTTQANEELDALLIEVSSAEGEETRIESNAEPNEVDTTSQQGTEVSQAAEGFTADDAVSNGVEQLLPDPSEEPPARAVLDVLGEPSFQETVELDILLSLPDRPLDALLTIVSPQEGSSAKDNFVMSYFQSLREFLKDPTMEHPEPPLYLERHGETFVLQASESIRRSDEKFVSGMQKPVDWNATSGHEPNEHVLSTTSESILDLDANQKSVKCEFSYQASIGRSQGFFKDLDAITTIHYGSDSKTNKIVTMQDETPLEHLLES